MSRRHRDDRELVLRKEDRLQEHRRRRREARLALARDGEDAVVPQGHDHLHAHRSEKPVAPDEARRARRHWKQPFWKRRAGERRARAAAVRRLDIA